MTKPTALFSFFVLLGATPAHAASEIDHEVSNLSNDADTMAILAGTVVDRGATPGLERAIDNQATHLVSDLGQLFDNDLVAMSDADLVSYITRLCAVYGVLLDTEDALRAAGEWNAADAVLECREAFAEYGAFLGRTYAARVRSGAFPIDAKKQKQWLPS